LSALTNEYLAITMEGSDYKLANTLFAQVGKACAAQKWRQYRRLRPEEMAGLVHKAITSNTNPFNLHQSLLSATSVHHINWLELVKQHNQQQAQLTQFGYKQSDLPTLDKASTYLLGQCYPEGCPAHPSYPSGHACFVGAAVTIVKALFDDREYLIKYMVPVVVKENNAFELTALHDGSQFHMTIGSELNKFASNVSIGRNWAGVHYRSDAQEGLNLGQEIAIDWLQEQARNYPLPEFKGFELTKMNGTRIRISGEIIELV